MRGHTGSEVRMRGHTGSEIRMRGHTGPLDCWIKVSLQDKTLTSGRMSLNTRLYGFM